jgi:hypothetical protein
VPGEQRQATAQEVEPVLHLHSCGSAPKRHESHVLREHHLVRMHVSCANGDMACSGSCVRHSSSCCPTARPGGLAAACLPKKLGCHMPLARLLPCAGRHAPPSRAVSHRVQYAVCMSCALCLPVCFPGQCVAGHRNWGSFLMTQCTDWQRVHSIA